MNGSVDWELLAKYFAGECSEREAAAVQAWRAADTRHTELLAELRQVWQAMEEEEEQEVSVRAAWQMLDERLRREEAHRSLAPSRSAQHRRARSLRPARRHRRARRISSRRSFLRAGAIVAVATLLVALLLRPSLFELPSSDASRKVFVTKRGQRAVVELTDGTRVRLNADSRLTLTSGFPEGRRTVYLEGEAYFDVARDTLHPFRVRTENLSVRVVGTIFDVRAYPGEEEAAVAVAEGAVALHAELGSAVPDTGVVLRPRHVGVVSSRGLEAVHQNAELAPYIAWTEGALVFRDASFEEVARRLERWYDLRVKVRVPIGAIDALNASFDEESLREVLGDIAVALRLQYQRDGRTVIYYRQRSALTPRAQNVVPAK